MERRELDSSGVTSDRGFDDKRVGFCDSGNAGEIDLHTISHYCDRRFCIPSLIFVCTENDFDLVKAF